MTADRTDAVRALLEETEAAHGRYEASELDGVYDADWPRWYAAYAVEHGLGGLLEREVDAAEVTETLATGFAEYDVTDPKPEGTWADHVARRLVAGS
jgi:hypothetical protein